MLRSTLVTGRGLRILCTVGLVAGALAVAVGAPSARADGGGGGVGKQFDPTAGQGQIAVKVTLTGTALGNGGTTASGSTSPGTVATVYTPPACSWSGNTTYSSGADMWTAYHDPQTAKIFSVGGEASYLPGIAEITAHKDEPGAWYTIVPGPKSTVVTSPGLSWDAITSACMDMMRAPLPAGSSSQHAGYIWVPAGTQPPAPQGAPPTPEQLRDAALASMTLPVPVLGHNPTTQSLVNLATWFWVPRGDFRTWDVTASAGAPVISATVTATPQSLSVSSAGGSSGPCSPGQGTTAWAPGVGDPAACTVDFLRSSVGQPEGAYAVTGQTSYTAGWTSNVAGHGGALADQVRAGTVALPVAESQAIVTGQG